MNQKKQITLFASFLILSVAVSNAAVITIAPGNVSSSSEIPPGFDRQDDYIVNGSGLTGGQHANDPPDGTMWLSTGDAFGGADPNPSVTFDLGAVYTINSFNVWNYNERTVSGVDLTGRGVNRVSVEFGLTGRSRFDSSGDHKLCPSRWSQHLHWGELQWFYPVQRTVHPVRHRFQPWR